MNNWTHMIPQEIKALRMKLMLTQVEFVKPLRVAFQSDNCYENGKSVPTMKILRKKLLLENGIEEA